VRNGLEVVIKSAVCILNFILVFLLNRESFFNFVGTYVLVTINSTKLDIIIFFKKMVFSTFWVYSFNILIIVSTFYMFCI
jgi:hypothetical protein